MLCSFFFNFNRVKEGVQHAKKGDYRNALSFYDRALDFDETCSDALVGKGAVFANEMKLKDAIESFEKALEINPEHSNAKLYLTAAKTKAEQIKEEMRQRMKSHEKEPIDVNSEEDSNSEKKRARHSPKRGEDRKAKKQKL